MSGQHPNQLTHLSHALKQRARDEGFDPVGIARLPGSPRLQLRTEALQRWLDHGYQADMAWMAAPRRRDASQLLEGVQSLLAVGLNYYVSAQSDPGSLKVARGLRAAHSRCMTETGAMSSGVRPCDAR